MFTRTSPHEPGLAGGRTFRCAGCGFPITLLASDEAPICPRCGGEEFNRDSLFTRHTEELPAPPAAERPEWLAGVRERLAGEGPHLAWQGETGLEVRPIPEGLSHLGRSLRVEIPLVDCTVSRRHALVHNDGSSCTLLDDHSLNGVFINGGQIDSRPLNDGDELELGGFRLYFVAA